MRHRYPAPGLDGYSLFEDDEGREFVWKNCEVPGCPNQVCTWKSEKFCFPHSDSGVTIEQLIADNSTKVPEKADV